MSLFQLGDFLLHSGNRSPFKIDCDALTDIDWETLAIMIKDSFQFCDVVGVPHGGMKLARVLERYKEPGFPILLVDDVLTTGTSLRRMREDITALYQHEDTPIIGIVVFARNECPAWVWPIFQMWNES